MDRFWMHIWVDLVSFWQFRMLLWLIEFSLEVRISCLETGWWHRSSAGVPEEHRIQCAGFLFGVDWFV